MRTETSRRTTAPVDPPRAADGLWFGKDLSDSEPIPEQAIERAVELMRSGRLHRYGEQGAGYPDPSLLEQEYAAYVGSRYCIAVSSCGAAMFLALKSLGVKPGDKVLTSSFTLAPVPGAIAHAGAQPVLVETTPDYTTDLNDLEHKAAGSGAKVLLLSHMRGHITDLRAVREICDRHGIALVEDCAHTMGARWEGRHTGTWGRIGCYSSQTYKHINSGEGGLLVTDDDDIAAQVILMSGCYMMYDQHILRPAPEVFERWRYVTPNFSMRMSNLAAALLRPQLAMLPERDERWNRIYADLARELATGAWRLAASARSARSVRAEFDPVFARPDRRRDRAVPRRMRARAACMSNGSVCPSRSPSPAISDTGITCRTAGHALLRPDPEPTARPSHAVVADAAGLLN